MPSVIDCLTLSAQPHVTQRSLCYKSWMGNLFTITGCMIYEISLAAHKNNFILKLCLHLPKGNKDKIPREFFVIYCTSICISWSFALMLRCVLTWVTKVLMQIILYVHTSRIQPVCHRSQPLQHK